MAAGRAMRLEAVALPLEGRASRTTTRAMIPFNSVDALGRCTLKPVQALLKVPSRTWHLYKSEAAGFTFCFQFQLAPLQRCRPGRRDSENRSESWSNSATRDPKISEAVMS